MKRCDTRTHTHSHSHSTACPIISACACSGDWTVSALSPEQVHYAAADAFVAVEVMDMRLQVVQHDKPMHAQPLHACGQVLKAMFDARTPPPTSAATDGSKASESTATPAPNAAGVTPQLTGALWRWCAPFRNLVVKPKVGHARGV